MLLTLILAPLTWTLCEKEDERLLDDIAPDPRSVGGSSLAVDMLGRCEV